MRVAIFPIISSRYVPSAPSYNFMVSFIKNVLKYDPEAVFYVILPDETFGKWDYGDLNFDLPRTHVIKLPMYENQFDDLVLITRDFWQRFNERFGDLYFDIIINERPALAPMLKKLSSFHLKSKSRRATVVNRDQFIVAKKWFNIGDFEELNEVMGWYSAPTIFQSDHQAKEAIEVARKWLKPVHMEKVMKNAIVFPLGIDCNDVDSINADERKNKFDTITINYSHKLFNEQKFVESLKVMDSVFAGGRRVDLQIVTGSSAGKMSMLKNAIPYKYITTYGRADRETFLKQIAKAHIFISNSVYEDFSATVVEQMYSGLIPVLIDKPWSRYLLPEGYPYLFSDMNEGNAMLRYVVDNYEAVALEWLPKIQEKILREFDLNNIAVTIYKKLETIVSDDYADIRFSPTLVKLMEEVFEALPNTYTIADIAKEVRKQSQHLDIEKDTESMSTSKFFVVDMITRKHRDKIIDLGGEIVSWQKKSPK